MLPTEEDVKRRRVAENWSLRRRQAKLHAEFEFLSREVGAPYRRRFRPVRVTVRSALSQTLSQTVHRFDRTLRDRREVLEGLEGTQAERGGYETVPQRH